MHVLVLYVQSDLCDFSHWFKQKEYVVHMKIILVLNIMVNDMWKQMEY